MEASGYEGFGWPDDIGDASSYSYSGGSIFFGTTTLTPYYDYCWMGLMLFFHNGRYGLLDFRDLPGNGDWRLTVDYWVADSGVTDFSMAPSDDDFHGSTVVSPF